LEKTWTKDYTLRYLHCKLFWSPVKEHVPGDGLSC